ncbi:TRAM domain-containing protein [Candidatus Gottesmanbacteria bacterium]|nr:TRAM domain-containing protein [Candidatus Gottesmanbacteria bacterium]
MAKKKILNTQLPNSAKLTDKHADEIKQATESPRRQPLEAFTKPTAVFTQALAREIVRNLTTLGQITSRPFRRRENNEKVQAPNLGEYPMLVDTSVLIDGRLLPIVNSGFLVGTLLVPQFVLGEIQHIADSSDSLRRAKGRRGLDVVNKLKGQKVNGYLKVKIISDDAIEVKEVDHKLVALAKRWSHLPSVRQVRLITIDFNLAHLARAQGIKVLSVNDLAQAIKMSIVAGEELTVKITHEGKEREQGVGYLTDGTMIVVDNARSRVGQDVLVVITKIHQTPAGQLFFARLK